MEEDIKVKIRKILEEDNEKENPSINSLDKLNKILKDEEVLDVEKDEKEIKDIWKDFVGATLKYTCNKDMDGKPKIKKITKTLSELIKNNKLEVSEDGTIVLLTRHNADIIEKLIERDDNYYPFYKLIFNSFCKEDIRLNVNKALFAVVRQIDSDNSTNVWRYKHIDEFNKIIEYMSNPANNFWKRLKDGDKKLPDELSSNNVGTTAVKSLSSKICKYLSEEMYGKDNYYINDKFIRHALLFYLDYYDVNHDTITTSSYLDNNARSYAELYSLLSNLHAERVKHNDGEITKSELDHIIWYCYKSFKTY